MLSKDSNLKNANIEVGTASLDELRFVNFERAHWNLSAPELVEYACRLKEGNITASGAFITLTGEHTGRSPNDRFVVKENFDWSGSFLE